MRSLCLIVFLAQLSEASLACEEELTPAPKNDWIELFNAKDLDGWYIILEDADQDQDPTKVYQVHEGVIHIYKDHTEGQVVPRGYFATQQEYSYYHLRFEYRWGQKKFQPRYDLPRDAGCLYHLVGADKVWPRCVECQVQQGDTGDCLTLRGSRLGTTIDATFQGVNTFKYLTEKQGGAARTIGNAQYQRIIKSELHEKEGWNTVEVIVHGAEEVFHVVNGHTVFCAKNLEQPGAEENDWKPLAHGRIGFQAECAEVRYRSIQIRAIPEGPLNAHEDARPR